jgi:hypothetical protein
MYIQQWNGTTKKKNTERFSSEWIRPAIGRHLEGFGGVEQGWEIGQIGIGLDEVVLAAGGIGAELVDLF